MPDWREAVRAHLISARLDLAAETELVEELAQHLEDRYQELRASGIAEEECRRRVESELTNEPLSSLASSKQRSAPPPLGHPPDKASPLAAFSHHLRMAFRSLRTRRAFSLMVIAILALGIGGNAVIFSVFNSLYLRPLPFPDSGRMVALDETAPKWNLPYVGISDIDLLSWRKNNASFDSMAFFRVNGYNIATTEAALRVDGAQVTREMLDVLRLVPALGRNFTQDEDKPGAGRVVMISHNLWLRMFQGDRGVLGRVVKLDEQPYTIVGVLPPEAVFPDRVELWVPLAPDPSRNTGYYVTGIGRLKDSVSVAQAQADLSRVHRAMISDGHPVNAITSPVVAPVRDRYLGVLKSASKLLMCGVALVLLIACVDISALLLVRGASRSHEIAIRMAIGASRSRIAAQLLTENLLLAFVGGILGIAIGQAGLRLALAHAPATLPLWINFSMDWRFALFCILVTCAAAFVFGIVPTLQCTRIDIRSSLGDSATRATPSRGQRTTLRILVVSQIAFALILSITAGLLVQAFRKVLAVDPGFNPENVLLFRVALPQLTYNQPEQRIHYFDSLLARLAVVPGVKAAAATSAPPLGGHWGGVFEADGGRDNLASTEKPTVLQIAVTPRYFDAAGMTLLAGRTFTEQDNQTQAPMVAMVNETFAKHFWGTETPIGKRIRRPGAKDSTGLFNSWLQVVGLLRDERHDGLDQAVSPTVFLPLAPVIRAADVNDGRALREMTYVLRTSSSPESLVGTAREIAHQLDTDVPIDRVQTLEDRLDNSLWTRRVYSWLFEGFAFVAVLLAMAGVYGIMSYTVSQRVPEFGIRMALGAQPRQLLQHVLTSGLTLVLLGIVLGLVNSFWATSLLRSLLFGVSSRDLFIYGAAVVGVSGAGLLAGLQPAIAASRVDPLRALRSE